MATVSLAKTSTIIHRLASAAAVKWYKNQSRATSAAYVPAIGTPVVLFMAYRQ
ncbi:hypothetical protein P280DRAFT_516774 [Massarina eburnea CBS 473.64]|uniref:Uncharacterized protein n=1 Tax=Massarina eburnea CBS 473.64 TaxID=1395130 RepID=A0A6A6S4Y2_9PLEO|nr:hypothetical protein P280DRAFT_516774 [Massarina eburnea CBS 473.64]